MARSTVERGTAVADRSRSRPRLSDEAQALCFFAGANSIFYGDKLLTASNPAVQHDLDLLEKLGLEAKAADRSAPAPSVHPGHPRCPQPKAQTTCDSVHT